MNPSLAPKRYPGKGQTRPLNSRSRFCLSPVLRTPVLRWRVQPLCAKITDRGLVIFGIVHLINALAGPKVSYWWTQLLLGVAELVLEGWALVSQTSRHPFSMVRAWPRLGISTILVTPGLSTCCR